LHGYMQPWSPSQIIGRWFYHFTRMFLLSNLSKEMVIDTVNFVIVSMYCNLLLIQRAVLVICFFFFSAIKVIDLWPWILNNLTPASFVFLLRLFTLIVDMVALCWEEKGPVPEPLSFWFERNFNQLFFLFH